MNDPRLAILVWPDQLARVLGHLEQEMHQEFDTTQMADGFISQRPITTPMPIFKATVSLSKAEEVALMEFFNACQGRHFSFRNPKTQRQVYASFMEIPFTRSQSMNFSRSHTTHDMEVEIILKDTTHSIQTSHRTRRGLQSESLTPRYRFALEPLVPLMRIPTRLRALRQALHYVERRFRYRICRPLHSDT